MSASRALGRQFAPDQVEYRSHPATGDPATGTGQWLHKVTAHIGEKQVGFLDWHPLHGKVQMVSTTSEARGKGVATGMWQHAHLAAQKNGLVPPRHSDVQLPDGRAWAQGMTAKSGPRPLSSRRMSRKPGAGQERLF